LCFGIGCEENLKPAIESKTFHHIGANTSTHSIRGIEHQNGTTGTFQVSGAIQTCQPRTDNNDIVGPIHRIA
jgi:hypothetical protein